MSKEEKDIKLEEILEKLEIANNELNKSDIELDKSIEIYTEAMKLVSKGNEKKALKILEKAIMRNWKDFYIEEGKNGNNFNGRNNKKETRKPNYNIEADF